MLEISLTTSVPSRTLNSLFSQLSNHTFFWSVLHHLFISFFILQVLAKKFGAALVSLEHRYYGMSSPFKLTTTKNLRYLSSKQALFDLAVFRQYYQVLMSLRCFRFIFKRVLHFLGTIFSVKTE